MRGRGFIYLSLYRKYRPKTFDDVISQPYITQTLTNQLKTGQNAHAYLFTGSRGTGKTTCAKILAKALNCTDLKNGNPCLKCGNCILTESGTPDIVEIDAASNNGVDDVRALRDEIVYSPVSCKYRVYIVDEVHMLSSNAFNALLKTIEEPPPHVIFILATTESHKVPATVASRCQRFEFSRISLTESAELLLRIAETENINLEDTAAAFISRLSDGGMRDAINLLDVCAASETKITCKVVEECAGVAGKEHLFSISNAVLDGECKEALTVLNILHSHSKDMSKLLEELMFHYRSLMLIKISPLSQSFDRAAAPDVFSLLPQDITDYEELAEKMPLEHIMRTLKILEEYFEKVGRSKQRRLLTEMCFVELCAPFGYKRENDEISFKREIKHGEKKKETVVFKTEEKTAETPPEIKIDTKAEKQPHAQDEIPLTYPYQRETSISSSEEIAAEKPFKIEAENKIEKPLQAFEEISLETDEIQPAQIISESQKDKKETKYRAWSDVLNLLPGYLSGMLEDVQTVFDSGKNLLTVCYEGELISGLVTNPDNREAVFAAVKRVSGKDCKVEFEKIKTTKEQSEKEEKTSNPVLEFLAALEAEGVEIKRKIRKETNK